jgi:hypothetical protein
MVFGGLERAGRLFRPQVQDLVNMADPISVFDCDGHIIESIPGNGAVSRSRRP